MADYTIEITYSVHQDENSRLVGKYCCRCVAEDVVKYLRLKHGVECFITSRTKEI